MVPIRKVLRFGKGIPKKTATLPYTGDVLVGLFVCCSENHVAKHVCKSLANIRVMTFICRVSRFSLIFHACRVPSRCSLTRQHKYISLLVSKRFRLAPCVPSLTFYTCHPDSTGHRGVPSQVEGEETEEAPVPASAQADNTIVFFFFFFFVPKKEPQRVSAFLRHAVIARPWNDSTI